MGVLGETISIGNEVRTATRAINDDHRDFASDGLLNSLHGVNSSLHHNQHWWHIDTCNTISTDGTLTPATRSALMAHWHLQNPQHSWHIDTCNTISIDGTLTPATQSALMAHWHLQHNQHWWDIDTCNTHAVSTDSIPTTTTHINSILTLWAQAIRIDIILTSATIYTDTVTATQCMYATCRQQALTALTPVMDASGCKPTLLTFCTHTHTHTH